MKCKNCEYYKVEEDVCGAFPQCSGMDCNALLPCEEERKRRRREAVRKSQQKRRALAVKTGLCMICAKNPARPGRKTCAACCKRIIESKKIHE